MNYHNITRDDMLNGDGLRVVLWVAGCEHHCHNCQNKQTWKLKGGIKFDENAEREIFYELSKNYISGLTLSGGDPLHKENRKEITEFVKKVKSVYPDKTIWLYTGYKYGQVKNLQVLNYIDVLVDSPFIDALKDVNYKWAGSTNQRVIDVKESKKQNKVILYC